MGVIETKDGIQLAYRDEGAGSPPMLFIHGMAAESAVFDEQMKFFGRDHRVVSYDQRGHGKSSKPLEGYDHLTLAEDARTVCDELGLERPVVVGHSLGGGVTVALASEYPALPHAIVILDSGFDRPPEVTTQLREFYDSLTDDEAYKAFVRRFVRERLFDAGDDPAVVEWAADIKMKVPREIFLAMGEGVLHFNMREAAMRITAPTLFIASSRPWIDLNVLHQARPDWYLGRTVGSGHSHQMLVPDQVNAMIVRFLDQIAAGFPKAQPSVY